MRICFFIPNLADGGAQRQCIELMNVMQRDPLLDLHLILLGPGQHEDKLDTTRLSVHRVSVRNFASPISLLFVLRILRKTKPDVLISWLHPADIISYAATRINRRVHWIMTERDSSYPDALIYNLRRRIGRSSGMIIANSRAGVEMWQAMTSDIPVELIPNIVIENQQSNTAHHSDPLFNELLYVGRLEEQKNVCAVASAFSSFALREETANLVVAGLGSELTNMSAIFEREGTIDRVQYLGFRNDIPTLMQHARVLISLSRHEGMPNVVMEAVQCGLPVVVSDIPEHRAILGDDYPFYVALDSPADTAAATIGRAWSLAPAGTDQLYGYARDVLAGSSADRVVAAYLAAFRKQKSSGP